MFDVNKFSLFNDSNHFEALAGDILQASSYIYSFPADTATPMPCIVGSSSKNDSENDLLCILYTYHHNS